MISGCEDNSDTGGVVVFCLGLKGLTGGRGRNAEVLNILPLVSKVFKGGNG